jgi:hypothetical protein
MIDKAINLSPLALDAMGDKRVMKAWARVTMDMFEAKPQNVVTITGKKDAKALMGFGLIKPVTYAGQPIQNRYRVPRSVAFISEEMGIGD